MDEGLLFCVLDETSEATDLNGDGDIGMDIAPAAHDERVVALLDTTDPAAMLRSTGLAISPGTLARRCSGARARAGNVGDWIVGFLVSEIAHNNLVMAGGFNDPLNHNASFQPDSVRRYTGCRPRPTRSCTGLRFAAWDADPVMDPPINTGLSGIPQVSLGGKVVATAASPPIVGTIQREMDQNCDLNNDTDGMLDDIPRWIEAAQDQMTVTYHTAATEMVAIDRTTAWWHERTGRDRQPVRRGGQRVAMDERDYNSDALNDYDLLGLLNPSLVAPSWLFDQDSSVGDEDFIVCDWLDGDPDAHLAQQHVRRGRLDVDQPGDRERRPERRRRHHRLHSGRRSRSAATLNFAGPLCAVSPGNAGHRSSQRSRVLPGQRGARVARLERRHGYERLRGDAHFALDLGHRGDLDGYQLRCDRSSKPARIRSTRSRVCSRPTRCSTASTTTMTTVACPMTPRWLASSGCSLCLIQLAAILSSGLVLAAASLGQEPAVADPTADGDFRRRGSDSSSVCLPDRSRSSRTGPAPGSRSKGDSERGGRRYRHTPSPAAQDPGLAGAGRCRPSCLLRGRNSPSARPLPERLIVSRFGFRIDSRSWPATSRRSSLSSRPAEDPRCSRRSARGASSSRSWRPGRLWFIDATGATPSLLVPGR